MKKIKLMKKRTLDEKREHQRQKKCELIAKLFILVRQQFQALHGELSFYRAVRSDFAQNADCSHKL